MEEILDFYLRLSENNCKEWFDAHRNEYQHVKALRDQLAMDFMHRIEEFDPRVHDLKLGDITYRVNRDIRFSTDKRPYKDWCGIYVCPKGKKSGMAGYYIHFEPAANTYFVCGGLYNPTKEVLASVREEIMLDPEGFHESVMACGEGWHLNWEGALKKMPKGYDETDPHSEYYRLKSYEVYLPLTREEVLRPDYLDRAIEALKRTYSFNERLNRCFDYAMEVAQED